MVASGLTDHLPASHPRAGRFDIFADSTHGGTLTHARGTHMLTPQTHVTLSTSGQLIESGTHTGASQASCLRVGHICYVAAALLLTF